MARREAGGRELSFHKASKRWYKSYRVGDQKQTKYFCSGKSARDERSYQRALKEYHAWWPQIVAEKHARKIGQPVRTNSCYIRSLPCRGYASDKRRKSAINRRSASGFLATYRCVPRVWSNTRHTRRSLTWSFPKQPRTASTVRHRRSGFTV